jgi:hypothetical protein
MHISSQRGLILKIETLKSLYSLIFGFGGWSLLGLTTSHISLISKTKTVLFGLVLVSFGSRTRWDQNKTMRDQQDET